LFVDDDDDDDDLVFDSFIDELCELVDFELERERNISACRRLSSRS
jgi:hypothetical protein